MTMTVLSLLLGLLLYGSGASVAVSDHMKCQKFIEGGYHSLSLSEITPIGTELYKVPAFNERTSASHYFFIDACVNKNDRFNVNSKGVLYLAGSLDHDIDQHYQVTVFSYDDSAIGINQCVRYTVDVTVEDVSGWPPYFNESCCFCPTVKNRPTNYPFFIEILLGEAQVPLEEMTSVLWTDRLYMDTSSSGCKIDMYFMLDGVRGMLSRGNFRSEPVIVKCYNKVTNEEFTAGDIEYFESIRKVPVRLQKDGWFAERQDYHFHKFNIGDRFIQEIFAEAFLACRFVFPGLLDVFSITGTFKILGCPDGYYGVQCEKQCICKNGATCHTLHGSCKCAPGWNGPSCDRHDREVCLGAPYREVFYGDHVTISARMYNVSLENRSVTWYLNGSTHTLNKLEGFAVRTDSSLNRAELAIFSVTEQLTGTYLCSVTDNNGKGTNFTDSTVLFFKGCNENYHGERCNLICDCKNGARCDRYRGCLCSAGWMSRNCDQACLPGYFGVYCQYQCLCDNNSTCNPKDGTCVCMPGTCGKNCHVRCECEKGDGFICEHSTGKCICTPPTQVKDKTSVVETGQRGLHYLQYLYIMLAITIVGLFLIPTCVACGVRRHRQQSGFKAIIDTEFDDYLQELLHEQPDIRSEWSLERNMIKIQREIGCGEFGRIELAEFRRGKATCLVAVKSLISGRCLPVSYRDFCHEILCLKRLHGHPNIINFLGIVISGDPKYIIVEYAARGDLLSYVQAFRNQGVTFREEKRLVRMATDITFALQHMDMERFIHRDLACRNVLIMEDYIAKIGDFGLSRDIYETGRYWKNPWSQCQGPLPFKWMPPEFMTQGIFETKGDIWSYGVMLWEIATLGETPFSNVPAHMMVSLLLDGKRLPQPENCTDNLYAIMRKCWQSQPEDRPNAQDLTNELKDLFTKEKKFFKTVVPDALGVE